MPDTPMDLQVLVQDLHSRFARVERAIMGDPTVGHRGLVTRVEALEQLEVDATKVHQAMEDRRAEGDRRLHERIDVLVADWNRAKYMVMGGAVGIGVASGFGGTWLFNAILGG